MSTPTLFGDEPQQVTSANIEVAVALGRIRSAYTEDIDKLTEVLKGGGSIPQMRAAVQAYDTLSAVGRELEAAMDKVSTLKIGN